ncbi:hypothetical protein K3495_g8755 [Podosphaera aphanis]|nr:hypothetical protein K3495_g8755 [Podosphaera aphanis]
MSKLNRALLRKCGKALQEANTRVAASESKSKRLECQLDEAGKKDRPRKRIRLDQNQRFAGGGRHSDRSWSWGGSDRKPGFSTE